MVEEKKKNTKKKAKAKAKKETEETKETKETKETEETEEEKEKASSSNLIVYALLGIILVLGISVGILMNKPSCPGAVGTCEVPSTTLASTAICPKCPSSSTSDENLRILYLMPIDCKNCDVAMIDDISGGIGIEIEKYVTDSVPRAMVLLTFKNKATTALAGSELNILNAICEFSGYKKACLLRDAMVGSPKTEICLDKYNLTKDQVAFYYTDWCPHCTRMKPWIKELENESYKFLWLNAENESDIKIAEECFSKILNIGGGIPQFACPSNGGLKVGEFSSKEKLKEFAEECKSSVE